MREKGNDEVIIRNEDTNSASVIYIAKRIQVIESAKKNGRDKGENIPDKVGEKRNLSFRITSVKDTAPKEELEEKDVKLASPESMRINR